MMTKWISTMVVLVACWATSGCTDGEETSSTDMATPVNPDTTTAICQNDEDCPVISAWSPTCDGDLLLIPTEVGPLGCVLGQCNPGFMLNETDCAANEQTCGPNPNSTIAGDACLPRDIPELRHTASTLTLEVMVGTDSAMSAHYGDGLDEYLEALMLQVHYMFQKLAPQVDINIVMTRHERDVDLNGLQMSEDKDLLLGYWTDWAIQENAPDDEDPRHFDYMILLTKTEFGTGWARTGVRICDPGAASIIYDKGYVAAKVVAHETGHSFGLGHEDGQEHIMHANPGTGWHDDSRVFLAGLNRETDPCLADFAPRPGYAGVPIVSLDAQCQTRFGTPVCEKFGAPTQCARLICKVDEWNCNWDDSPVLDGSPCGEEMWCISGQCIPRPATDTPGP